MKTKMRIAVLFGGRSGEHDVSRRSAASVLRSLDPQRYEPLLLGIDRRGVWHLQPRPLFRSEGGAEVLAIEETDSLVAVAPGRGLTVAQEPLDVEVVFPVLHGTFGEDGTVQGLLELAGLPYVGSGVLGSSVAMDKEKTKQIWLQEGLPVADFRVLRRRDPPELAAQLAARLGYPLFVKPAAAGSSVGISRVGEPAGLPAAVELAFRFDLKVLLESAVVGREVECAVLGNDDPLAFPPGEIVPSHEFYSYQAKYVDPHGAELKLPAELDADSERRVRELAVRAFRAVECSGMARVDFFVDGQSGRPLLNEINTLPGFTNISMYPKLCALAGLEFPRLLDRLVELAMERHRARAALSYDYTAAT